MAEVEASSVQRLVVSESAIKNMTKNRILRSVLACRVERLSIVLY